MTMTLNNVGFYWTFGRTKLSLTWAIASGLACPMPPYVSPTCDWNLESIRKYIHTIPATFEPDDPEAAIEPVIAD